jgi:hypothetical protein
MKPPACAASGKHQEQLIDWFDEALKRFGAKRHKVFPKQAASPTCAASGKHQEQLIDWFDEALKRFGAKRHK